MSDSYLLSGKKAFVTGGKRRIGRGIALALAEAGCDVGINDLHDDDDAGKTLGLIRAMGREAEFFAGDISASAQVEAMFAAFLERFGRIDILVNNPYGGTGEPFLELSEENWDQNLDVGLKGFFCVRSKRRAPWWRRAMEGPSSAPPRCTGVGRGRTTRPTGPPKPASCA